MSPYDVRQTQAITVQIKEKFGTLQDSLKPKKKFGFKSKYKKTASSQPSGTQADETSKSDVPDKSSLNDDDTSVNDEGSYKITNATGKELIDVPPQEVNGRDVIINGLKKEDNSDKVTVRILGSPGTLHATDMANITVLCGPVRTSIFIENCINCDFVVACQQLRIHSTKHSNFYLHVTSKGIIEDCHSVGFAPYNLSYPALSDDFSNSGLNEEVNNWDKIDDFNWLSQEKSPNWHILRETQRKKDWLL